MRILVSGFSIVILTFALGLANCIFSQSQLNNEVFDDFISSELTKWRVPGAAVAVVKDGEVIYAKGFGYRDIKLKLLADENTLFAVGSLTKAITATTVGISVDQGIFDWDSRVVDLLPYFELKDPFATQKINLIDLLCHRSGLPGHTFMWYFTDFDREEIIRRLRHLDPSADFRTTFQYHASMYTLAGYLVGQRSKTTWEEFTVKNIFEPLKMTRSNFSYMDMEKDSNHSRPYIEKDGVVIETEFHKSQHLSAPAGSVNSSVSEMANWMMMNLNHGVFNSHRIISSESLSYIQSPHITFPSTSSDVGVGPEGAVYSYPMYGLGWNIGTYHDQVVIEHMGAIDGFSSQMTLLPRINAGIVVLANNQVGGDSFCAAVINRITTELLGKEPFDFSNWLTNQGVGEENSKIREVEVSYSKPNRDLKDYVGTYMDEGYGEIVITQIANKLHLKYYRYDVDLQHLSHDVFKTVKGVVNRKVNFLASTNGDIDRFEIQWDRSVKPIVFRKSDR